MSQDQTPRPQVPASSARRRWLKAGGIVIAIAALLMARPAWHLVSMSSRDVDGREPVPEGMADDASRLNLTAVHEVWPIPAEPLAAEQQLAELLQRAARDKLAVSIAGSRHTMGGHTIAPDGIVIDMTPFRHMELDDDAELLHVGAGAKWSEIIPYLDARGRSVAVMQSNNSFTVGGSLSVNCHGWQFGKPPISSTVERLRVMTADGRIHSCSRSENPELFSLVLGGYGLFGVILEADLRVVPNERYRLEQFIVPATEALATFEQRVTDDPDVAMVYARMNIVPAEFLEDVILNVFVRDPSDATLPPLEAAGLQGLRRSLFRGSVGSNYGKELRWEAETRLQPHLQRRHFSRNQLLNEGVEVFQGRTSGETDILHEYFVPREGVEAFIANCRRIIPEHRCDLLNVTVRSVAEDEDTFLRYADRTMFSFVMLFSQQRTAEADSEMRTLTEELVDAAHLSGGRYYLPYRLHATPTQFLRAYPMAWRFFDLKRSHDPEGVFQNRFYQQYGLAK